MAESVQDETLSNILGNGDVLNFDCAVCLQSCVHPAELPCGHVFCYLCIKGIVNQGRRCAMCRQSIPLDYLEKPRLLKPMDAEISVQGCEDSHVWFYEGHNGWWQYDERTNLELESAYQKGERSCDLLIAGFLYVADFDGMLQYRKNDPSRKRRIKRDLATTAKKGIAGLKATKNCDLASSDTIESVLNGTIQNLPVTTSSSSNNSSNIRIFTSGSNFSHYSEPLGTQRIQESLSRCSSTFRPANVTNSNVTLLPNSPAAPTRDINLDSVTQDTVDWTIEQIEALNLELLNDYESLYRDVNTFESTQENLNQSRWRRTPSNYIRRYLNVNNSQNELVENSSTDRFSHTLSNLSTEVSPEENNSVYSNLNEIQRERSLQSEIEEAPPLPPPRNRSMLRGRLRTDSLDSSSSAHESPTSKQ